MDRSELDEKVTRAWLVFSAACLVGVVLVSCVAVVFVALGWF
jgi:hypothetical protein